ncbi:hypothetical protein, partial [Streptomyces sp. NPDC058424]|uniref:hypothetical protein n=1 Tax=Streptomyces sp. NPDC058424 TaxID=3346491 RepID=UPI003662D884
PVLHGNHPLLLTLDEDHDDQEIARWVTVHPPISGQFSPVAERLPRRSAQYTDCPPHRGVSRYVDR